jgi:hypothetical protein
MNNMRMLIMLKRRSWLARKQLYLPKKNKTENRKNDPSHEKEKRNTLPGIREGRGGTPINV